MIDTPGILDHPLEDRNTIEMLSITALAHLRACVLYFMDLSEECGYSIADQVKLFQNIKPLFANKPLFLVISKIDVKRLEDLDAADAALVQSIMVSGVEVVQLSCHADQGVIEARNKACEKLLEARVETKMRSQRVTDVLSRIHVALPQGRDEKLRPPSIPENALLRRKDKFDKNDPNRARLERDEEDENGGAGVFNVDLKSNGIYSAC